MDFYSLVFNDTIDNDTIDNDILNNNNNNICLITNEKIEDKYLVKLQCGHTFHYNAIFKEILYNKNTNNNNKYCKQFKLQKNEIQCPYCRNIQDKLLPYREDMEMKKWINCPKKYCMNMKQCNTISCRQYSDTNYCMTCIRKQEKNKQIKRCISIIKSGKRIGEKCNNQIHNIDTLIPNPNNELYCGIHRKKLKLKLIQKLIQQLKIKLKLKLKIKRI